MPTPSPRPTPTHRIILGATLALGAYIQLITIYKYHFNMDELQFLSMAQGPSLQEVWRRALTEVHPPFASFIRHLLLSTSSDPFAERIFSILAETGSIIGIYHLGKSVKNKNVGIFCAAIMAFSPVAVVSTFTLRNYAFFMLLLTWACVFYFRWQYKERSKNLLAYLLLIALASACHFSGFFVATALGVTSGAGLLFKKKFWQLAKLSLLHLPLAILAGILAYHYMLPGKTIALWREYGHITGILSPPEQGIDNKIIIPLITYFSPYLHTLHTLQEEGVLTGIWLYWCSAGVMLAGIVSLLVYLWALGKTWHHNKAVFFPTLLIWVLALFLSWHGIYPLSTALRHSLYLLPFFLLPLGIWLSPVIMRILQNARTATALAVSLAGFAFVTWVTLPYDAELCLTTRDFDDSITFLDTHSKAGDVIVTGPVGAYFYLIYALDQGKTPYDHYTDIPYRNHTTLLAPFAYAPRKPFTSWREFKDYLTKRLAEGIVPMDGNVWFANIGWQGQEIWYLMQCGPAKPLMEHYFSREGTILFSMKASALRAFLGNNEAWEHCYTDYHPSVIAKKIHPPVNWSISSAPAEAPAPAPASQETIH